MSQQPIIDLICKTLGPNVALVVNADGQVLTLGARLEAQTEETPAPPASGIFGLGREDAACTDCGEPMRYHA